MKKIIMHNAELYNSVHLILEEVITFIKIKIIAGVTEPTDTSTIKFPTEFLYFSS